MQLAILCALAVHSTSSGLARSGLPTGQRSQSLQAKAAKADPSHRRGIAYKMTDISNTLDRLVCLTLQVLVLKSKAATAYLQLTTRLPNTQNSFENNKFAASHKQNRASNPLRRKLYKEKRRNLKSIFKETHAIQQWQVFSHLRTGYLRAKQTTMNTFGCHKKACENE